MGVWCLGWLQAVEAGVKFSTPGVGQEVFTYWVIGCVLVVLCFPTAPCLSLLTTESGVAWLPCMPLALCCAHITTACKLGVPCWCGLRRVCIGQASSAT